MQFSYCYIYFYLLSRHALLFNMHETPAPYVTIFQHLTFTNNHHHIWEFNLSGLNYLVTIWNYKWTGLPSAELYSTFVKMPCCQNSVKCKSFLTLTMQNIIVWYLISFLRSAENLFEWPTQRSFRESFKYCWCEWRPL